jgi:hypothetical protein
LILGSLFADIFLCVKLRVDFLIKLNLSIFYFACYLLSFADAHSCFALWVLEGFIPAEEEFKPLHPSGHF